MALQIKVQKMKRKGQPDKWYGKAVKWQDVSLATIAEKISMDNSVTESDVYAVLKALVYEMKNSYRWETPSNLTDSAVFT